MSVYFAILTVKAANSGIRVELNFAISAREGSPSTDFRESFATKRRVAFTWDATVFVKCEGWMESVTYP